MIQTLKLGRIATNKESGIKKNKKNAAKRDTPGPSYQCNSLLCLNFLAKLFLSVKKYFCRGKIKDAKSHDPARNKRNTTPLPPTPPPPGNRGGDGGGVVEGVATSM